MKTSIFDMNFTLPPMVEMTEVLKGTQYGATYSALPWMCPCGWNTVIDGHRC